MNRENRRALAKMSSAQVDAFVNMLCEQEKEKSFYEGQAQMLYCIMGFLRIDKGHTGNYLRKFLRELDDFSASVNAYGKGSMAEIDKILKAECGFDMEKEYGEIEKGRKATAKTA